MCQAAICCRMLSLLLIPFVRAHLKLPLSVLLTGFQLDVSHLHGRKHPLHTVEEKGKEDEEGDMMMCNRLTDSGSFSALTHGCVTVKTIHFNSAYNNKRHDFDETLLFLNSS